MEDETTLMGDRPMRVFKYRIEPEEYTSNEDIRFLLDQ
jgi:hypothetical protein